METTLEIGVRTTEIDVKNRKLIDIVQMILTAEEAYGGGNPD